MQIVATNLKLNPPKLGWEPQVTLNHNCNCNHLNTGQVWYSNGQNVSCCHMVQFTYGGLKTTEKMCFKIKMLSFQMVCLITWSDLDQTNWKKSVRKAQTIQISGDRYSDGYCISQPLMAVGTVQRIYLWWKWNTRKTYSELWHQEARACSSAGGTRDAIMTLFASETSYKGQPVATLPGNE